MRLFDTLRWWIVGLGLSWSLFSASAKDLRWVDLGGERIAYVEAGRGEPVIFVHGGLQDYRVWSQHTRSFSKRYRMIAYSRRNYYPNASAATGASDGAAELHAADLAALVECLQLGPVHVVAHSSGAHAALFFAAANPKLVRSLSVNEPPAMGLLGDSPQEKEALADFTTRVAAAYGSFRRGAIQEGLRLFSDAVGGSGSYEKRSNAVKAMMADNVAPYIAAATTKAPRPIFSCALAQRITAPTLITRGERSPAIFHLVADMLERCLPQAQRVVIQGASHSVPSEAPLAYRQAVLAFLERNTGRPLTH